MDDLFELDQGVDADVPVAVATPAPAAPRLRLARDEDDERSTRKRAALLQLDEGDAALDADVSAVREDELGRLLRREAELLRRKGAAAALNAQHCFWLLEGTSDEASVLASVQAMGPMVKEAADSLRASLAAFSTYGAPSERRELEQALELLEGEHATWTLLHATLSDLRAFEEQQPLADADALELAAHDEWISDESFFLLATRHDATLRRWLRVIVWLETLGLDAAARTERVRCDRFWEYTHMALARGGVGDVGDDDDDGNRQQWPTEKSADSSLQRLLVRSLDVDAPLQSGDQQRQLHSMDASLDARLLRRLWALVRAGQLGAAVAECHGCQQQWRSAVLAGMQYHHEPRALGRDEPSDARGNGRPELLRRVCDALAANERLDVHERAIYGLFAGRLERLTPVCSTYHDHLWAHYKVNLLQRMLALRSPTLDQTVLPVDDESMFDAVSRRPLLSAGVTGASMTGAEAARTPFVAMQRMIVLGQLNELVEYVLEICQLSDCPPSLSRFCSHLLLVLSRVRAPHLNPQPALLLPAAKSLLELHVASCLAPLQHQCPATLVALCAQLDDAQRYRCVARYIVQHIEQQQRTAFGAAEQQDFWRQNRSFAEAQHSQQRLLAVQACEAARMDVVRVLRLVVASLLPPSSASASWGGNAASDDVPATGTLVSILGWLTLRPAHWAESVHTANRMCRALTLAGRVSALRAVLDALPPATHDRARAQCGGGGGDAFAVEFWYHQLLAHAHDAFAKWKDCRGVSSEGTVLALYEEAEAALQEVLRFPASALFAAPEPFSAASSNDVAQTEDQHVRAAVRRRSVTHVFTVLHFMHHAMGRFDSCLALADVLAERSLWRTFVSAGSTVELQRVLALFRDSAVAALRSGHDDFLAFDARK